MVSDVNLHPYTVERKLMAEVDELKTLVKELKAQLAAGGGGGGNAEAVAAVANIEAKMEEKSAERAVVANAGYEVRRCTLTSG